jgi:phosphate transport system permease protein
VLQRYVKPTVEIMAALPSVVLGFLAGLWLAPILERTFPALILAFLLLPVAVWIAGYSWSRLPLEARGRFPVGAEVFLYLVVVAATLWLCLRLSPGFEALAFGGNFQNWLLESTGLRYDQRNAIVVGLAMGFAVIPIIFAISEDAFSNVPRNLIAGSLALGANRWQTVTRVVLPTASPGIFSAIMIGFGACRGRDHDRAHGHRQHADPGVEHRSTASARCPPTSRSRSPRRRHGQHATTEPSSWRPWCSSP